MPVPAAYSRFARLLALGEWLADRVARRPRSHAARLSAELLEDRVVPDGGRPLPLPVIFVGDAAGSVVKGYNAETSALNFTTTAFDSSFTGGVRVAVGDFTGDGYPDAVVAAGPGGGPRVRILDGHTGDEIAGPLGSFWAFGETFTGGVNVAAADVDGDGVPDVVAAAGPGGGPHVKVFSGATGDVIDSFYAYDPDFDGGISVAAADLTGDGKAEVAVGAGAGGGPRVVVYDLTTGDPIGGPLGSFWAFAETFTGGVYLGADALAGDVDSDGHLDLAVGSGAGMAAEVKVYSGATGDVLLDLTPFGTFTGGARVALAYVDNDVFADVIVGSGPGMTDTVRVFSGATGDQLAAPLGEYAPFGAATGGVFVAASNDPFTPTINFTGGPGMAGTVVGQAVSYTVTVNGMTLPPDPFTGLGGGTYVPTGTVRFRAYASGSFTAILDETVALTAATSPDATATYTWDSLPVGAFTIYFDYSGDAAFYAVSTLDSLGVATPVGPAAEAPEDCLCVPGPVGAAGGTTTSATPRTSAAGVNVASGAVTVGATDLATGGFGTPLDAARTWTSAPGYADGAFGDGSTLGQLPHLTQVNGDNSVALVTGGTAARFFDYYQGAYHARFFDAATLTHDTTTTHTFTVADGAGGTFTFYDFSGSTPTGRGGKLSEMADAAGNVTSVTSWDGSGRPLTVERTTGSGAALRAETFTFTYISSGTNAGLVDTLTQAHKAGSAGSYQTVRTAEYTYHDGTTGVGTARDLRTAVVKDAGGTVIDTSYYRYYTSGAAAGLLKYAFGAAAFERLTAALGTGVDALTDGQVDDYADKYLAYDGSGRVTTAVDAAAGCSVCSGGQGTFTYAYTTNSSAGLRLPNAWANKTVETLPDGNTNTYYTNAAGQVMLKVYTDTATSDEWCWYTRFDAAGRVVLTADPSAVSGYSEGSADLVNVSSGNAAYLRDGDGLIRTTTYAAATTATTSTAGTAAGYVSGTALLHGETGTPVPQSAQTYLLSPTGTVVPAASTVYRNDNGTGGQTTTTSYTWQGSTARPASVTVTMPTVTTGQNGSGSATSTTAVYDGFGRPVWMMDQGGFLTYTEYDAATGATVKAIADVDTTQTTTFVSLPSGWSTPSGGGLHLTTTYEVDAEGRATKVTHPGGRVDYTVYDDAAHETRYYPGWNTTTNAPTGPTMVTRADQANGYTESLTMSAAPAVSSGRPTGAESISAVQSLSRSYVNSAGQVVSSDSYFDLGGLTYSTSATLGTEGVNFYRTRYAYDQTGQQNRMVSPAGTITRTVHDGQGRVVSEWVGTNDTPGSGYWSPTNAAGMVKVREYEYDGGGVGDGNVTTVTEYPGLSQPARVSETYYDWRNRAVAAKAGVETTESTSVNRPITYTDYDNLGHVIQSRVYDGDGVTVTTTSGVPVAPSSSLLRAQSTTSYDELGRAYRSDTYSVDPSSGSVGSYTLNSQTWFDARGQVVKSSSPGGLVSKMAYDGVGRTTVSYLTDGGGDSGYADADDVTGDTVLTQSETTYDAAGNAILGVTRERFHDATGTGALGTPSSGVGARVSYSAAYYGAGDRMTASVTVGTNGGSAWTRPGSVPARSDTVLVTSVEYAADAVQTVKLTGAPTGGTFTLTFGGYTTSGLAYNASAATVQTALAGLTSVGSGNVVVTAATGGGWQVRFAGTLAGTWQARLTASGASLTGGTSPGVAVATVSAGGDVGRAAATTDPAGRVSRTYADAAGRATQTVEAFTDGAVTDTSNKTTLYAYGAAGMTSLTAALTGGGGQTTQWVFGVTTAGGSGLDSSDVSAATRWPDPTTGVASSSEQETTTVNALGQTVTSTDRNGTTHTLTYDILGRVTADAVTTLGSGVDGAVRRIETAYDGQGNAYLVTSYDAASGGSVVNQVRRGYNGLGQLTAEWQAHSGTVNTSTSPAVTYTYSEMPSGANHSRLTAITYPSGYSVGYSYASGLDATVSRLSALTDTSGTLESYSYLGLGTVVVRSHPQPGIDLTYLKRSGESDGDAGDKYIGLDRFGRVVDQRWVVSSTGTATDRFQYGYDRDGNRLYRDNLVNAAFGEVYTYDGLNQVASFARGTLNGGRTAVTGTPARTQTWDYDTVGNWDGIDVDGTTQTRTANAQNEVTSIGSLTTPGYDANGNMTTAETGLRFVYDAWNRLVAVKNSAGTTTLETHAYDGLNRRAATTAGGTTTDLYYTSAWQVAEERVGGAVTQRYVWSPVYVDALVLRDRDTDADGTPDERLWVQQDANWNVTAVTDGSGAVDERYAYDPFGAATIYSPTWGTVRTTSSYAWQYTFQGLRADGVTGNLHARNRDYDPTLGRWTSLDPMEFAAGDQNLYRFVGNEPTNELDPSGLQGLDGTIPEHVPMTTHRAYHILDAEIARWRGQSWMYAANLLQHYLRFGNQAGPLGTHHATPEETAEVKRESAASIRTLTEYAVGHHKLNGGSITQGTTVQFNDKIRYYSAFGENDIGNGGSYWPLATERFKFLSNSLFYAMGGVNVYITIKIGNVICRDNQTIYDADVSVRYYDNYEWPASWLKERVLTYSAAAFLQRAAGYKTFKTKVTFTDSLKELVYDPRLNRYYYLKNGGGAELPEID